MVPAPEVVANLSLEGHVAMVTGSSSGIGRAQAKALAKAGAQVVCVARRQERLEELAHDIARAGGQAAPIAADLSDLAGLEGVAEAVSQPFGPPDILVHGAGVNLRQPIDEVTLETWDLTLKLNLSCPFFLTRHLVGPMIKAGWGRVILIASLQSKRAFPLSAPYGASKGGVMQLTRAMAQAWSSQGVCVNGIAPGFFPTELTEPVFGDPAKAGAMADNTFMGRNGRLEDLDGITVFLASDACAYITGQTIFVDGGFSAG